MFYKVYVSLSEPGTKVLESDFLVNGGRWDVVQSCQDEALRLWQSLRDVSRVHFVASHGLTDVLVMFPRGSRPEVLAV